MHAHRVLRKAGRGAHGRACRGPGVQLQAGGSAQQPQPRLLSPRRWAACSSQPPASCTRPPRAPPTAWSPLCPASPQPPTPPRTTLCPASPRLPTQASSSKATSDSRLPAPSLSQHSAPPKHHPAATGRAGPRCRAPSSEVPSKISRWILGKPKQGSPVPEPRSGKETERDAPQKCRGGQRRGAPFPLTPHGAHTGLARVPAGPRSPRQAPRGAERARWQPSRARPLPTAPVSLTCGSTPAVTPRLGTGAACMGVYL